MVELKKISSSLDLTEWDAYLERQETILVNSGLGLPLAPTEHRFLCCAEDGSTCGLIRLLLNGHVARLFVHCASNVDAFRAVLREIVEKMYTEMAVVRLQAEVVSECFHDIRLYQSIGFREEGVLRDHVIIDNKPYNLTILGLLREDIDVGSNPCK